MPAFARLARLFPVLVVLSACGDDGILSSSPKTGVTILADLHHTAIGRHLLSSAPSLVAARELLENNRHIGLARGLIEFSSRAFAVALTQDQVQIPGRSGGVLDISGNTWTFRDDFTPWLPYYPGNSIEINGILNVDESQNPRVPVTGTVKTRGPESTATLNLVIEVTGDGLVVTGTITIDHGHYEEEYDIAAILALVGLF